MTPEGEVHQRQAVRSWYRYLIARKVASQAIIALAEARREATGFYRRNTGNWQEETRLGEETYLLAKLAKEAKETEAARWQALQASQAKAGLDSQALDTLIYHDDAKGRMAS